MKVYDEDENTNTDPDPLVRGIDPRIRIHNKCRESATLGERNLSQIRSKVDFWMQCSGSETLSYGYNDSRICTISSSLKIKKIPLTKDLHQTT